MCLLAFAVAYGTMTCIGVYFGALLGVMASHAVSHTHTHMYEYIMQFVDNNDQNTQCEAFCGKSPASALNVWEVERGV